MWLLANICGDSIQARDELLQTSLPLFLLGIVSLHMVQLGILRVATWCISNLMKGKPNPPFEQVGN